MARGDRLLFGNDGKGPWSERWLLERDLAHCAARQGDLGFLNHLTCIGHFSLEYCIKNPGDLTFDGLPIHYAVYYEQLGAVDMLLRASSNLDTIHGSSKRGSLLNFAARHGKVACLEYLWSVGLDSVPCISSDGYRRDSVLEAAGRYGQTEVVQRLLKLQIRWSSDTIDDAMYLAAQNSHLDTVQALLATDEYTRRGLGRTLLLAFSELRRLHMPDLTNSCKHQLLDLILGHCSKSDRWKDFADGMPLQVGLLPLLRFFLKKGANPNTRGHAGRTALHILCNAEVRFPSDSEFTSRYLETFKLLIEYGARWDVLDHLDRRPLEYAARNHDTRILSFCIDAGALQRSDWDTPIQHDTSDCWLPEIVAMVWHADFNSSSTA